MKPLTSVVTPVYNARDFIADTIRSVQQQSVTDWEHIIVDDMSSDDTVEIVSQFAAKDPRVKLFHLQKNMGPAAARNRAMEEAKGRFIAFIDSDDIWLPHKLETQIAFMQKNEVALSYTNFERISERDGQTLGYVESPQEVTYRDLLRSNQIACSTAIFDRSVTGPVFMPMIRKRQDWGLWVQITRKGFIGRNVGENLVRYRVRSNSVSSNKIKAMVYTWRFYRDVLQVPVFERIYRTVAYAVINARKYRRAAKSRPNAGY